MCIMGGAIEYELAVFHSKKDDGKWVVYRKDVTISQPFGQIARAFFFFLPPIFDFAFS